VLLLIPCEILNIPLFPLHGRASVPTISFFVNGCFVVDYNNNNDNVTIIIIKMILMMMMMMMIIIIIIILERHKSKHEVKELQKTAMLAQHTHCGKC
jgi:hypothetical protein